MLSSLSRVSRGPIRRLLCTYEASELCPLPQRLSPAPVSKQTQISSKELPNGVKIVSRDAYVENVSLKFSVGCGSRHEQAHEKGAAHLLSVAAFAGTQSRDGLLLMREIENNGFAVNVSADREKTVYSIRCVPELATEAAAIISEVILSPPKYSYTIKERISAAMYDYELRKSSPQVTLTEMLYEAAYGEGTPMGSSCYATNINRLKVEDVLAFRSRYFDSPNLTIAADGLSLNDLESIGTGFHGQKSSGTAESPYCGGVVRRSADFKGDIHASLAFPAAHGANSKAFAVLQAVLDTRLATKTKGANNGRVKSFHSMGSDCGLVGVYIAASNKKDTEDLLALTISELKDIATKVDVTAAKAKVSLANACALEGGDCAASILLTASSQGIPALNFVNAMDVTNDAVMAAAAAVLQSKPSYAVLGETFGVKPYDALRNMMR